MRRNRRFDGIAAGLRRTGRIIRMEWRRLPLSYCVGLGSFSLLLVELLAALAFSLLKEMGVTLRLSSGAILVIVVVTLVIAAVSIIGILIGMVTLSFTKKSDHDKRLFQNAETARRDLAVPPPRLPLDLPYQDEISALKENMRFLLGLLLFWLWASWVLFGRRWFADGSIGERGFSIFFALCATAFASLETARRVRRLYDRLRCYRTPFKGLEGDKEDVTEK